MIGWQAARQVMKGQVLQKVGPVVEPPAGLRDGLWQAMRQLVPAMRFDGAETPRLPVVPRLCLSAGRETWPLLPVMPGLLLPPGGPARALAGYGAGDEEARRSLRLSAGRFTPSGDVQCAAARSGQVPAGL